MVEDVEIREVGDSWSIPRGWEWKTMEEVAEVVNGATPKTDDSTNYEGGTIAWLTPADLSGYTEKFIDQGARFITKSGLESCSTNLLPKGTVLFTSRAPIGYVAIASGEVCTNQGFKSYVPDPKQVTSDYLYWWLKGAKPMAEAVASGTTFLELSTVKARKLPIPLAPLPEQRRIVEAIELQLGRLDAAVARLHAAKAKLKRYKQAVLKAAVEGAFLYPELEQNELPTGWQVASLGELVEDPRYGTSKKCGADAKGVPVLRIPNIGDGIVSQADLKYASFDAKERKAYELREGDLLTIRSNGSVDLVGKCALIREVDEHFLYAGYLIRLRPKRDLAEPRFLLYHLSSLPSRVEIESKAKSTSGVNNINAQELKDLTITLPPLKDQVAICDKVEVLISEMNALETTLDTQLAQSTRLRQSVLKRAFEGRLV